MRQVADYEDKPLDLVEHVRPQDRHRHHPPQRPAPPVIPGTNGKQIGQIAAPESSVLCITANLAADGRDGSKAD
jgi:hypothetical protein